MGAILESSYDPNYGARPVERYLEGTVVTELSRMLISGELQNGATVHIEGIEGGELDGEDSSLDDRNYPLAKKARTLSYHVVAGMDAGEKDSDMPDDMEL